MRLFQRRCAFTLIELLVVIASIAILTAILFPVFAQARAKARQVVCLNNEKQITMAMQLYTQDYDSRWIDLYPNYNENNPLKPAYPANGPLWGLSRNTPAITNCLLTSYLRSQDVFTCPVQHRKGGRVSNATAGGMWNPLYAINSLDSRLVNFAGHVPPDSVGKQWLYCGPFGRLATQQTHPATTMILWEHNSTALQCNLWDTTPNHWDAEHQGGFNAAFADGHVKRWTLGRMTNQLVCYWDLP